MKNPENRIKGTYGDPLTDKIIGILLGFKETLIKRDLWMDIITIREAKEEIQQLIKEQIKESKKEK